uniref:Uncharacterized protein n=1 Tax=Panagrellus redivivus TaxID=6233 RepID=A0A7E4VWT5_PANRE
MTTFVKDRPEPSKNKAWPNVYITVETSSSKFDTDLRGEEEASVRPEEAGKSLFLTMHPKPQSSKRLVAPAIQTSVVPLQKTQNTFGDRPPKDTRKRTKAGKLSAILSRLTAPWLLNTNTIIASSLYYILSSEGEERKNKTEIGTNALWCTIAIGEGSANKDDKCAIHGLREGLFPARRRSQWNFTRKQMTLARGYTGVNNASLKVQWEGQSMAWGVKM